MKARNLFLLIIIFTSILITINNSLIDNTNFDSSEDFNEDNFLDIRCTSGEEYEREPTYPGLINEPVPDPDLDPSTP